MAWEGYTINQKWDHLKRLVESAARGTHRIADEQPPLAKYMNGKERAYLTILGWMKDMEMGVQLMDPEKSTFLKSKDLQKTKRK